MDEIRNIAITHNHYGIGRFNVSLDVLFTLFPVRGYPFKKS